MTATNTSKAISVVTFLLLFSKVIGFVREMLIAAFFGANYQTDAYNMAINIVFFFTTIISMGLATVIIPMYNHKNVEFTKEKADSFVNNILMITTLFYLVLSVLGVMFAPVLVRVFAPSFSNEIYDLTIIIIRTMFGFTIAFNVVNFITSILQIHQKFAITVLAGFPFNIITIIFVILFSETLGIFALVFSYALSLVVQATLLVLAARKVFKIKMNISFSNGDFAEVVKLSLPMYISVAAWEINVVIDRILASGLPEGSITAMGFATRLRDLPNGIIATAILSVTYPLLAKHAANKDYISLKSTTTKTLSLLAIIIFPIVAISIYYPVEITRIVFERGAFTQDSTTKTANIFLYLAVSLIFTSAVTLLNNVFVSTKDTKTPQIVGVATVVCNIILNIVLVQQMGAAGLALSTSITFIIGFVMLLLLFRLKIGHFGGKTLLKNISKCVLATLCMIPVLLTFEYLRNSLPLLIFFVLASAASLGVYALVLYILKVDLFMDMIGRIVNTLKSRFGKSENQT